MNTSNKSVTEDPFQLKRVHGESTSPNGYKYRESSVHVKTTVRDVARHRDHPPVFYVRVPEEKVDQYKSLRLSDQQREQHLVNYRFPELSKARHNFNCDDIPKHKLKKIHGHDLTQFSSQVLQLINEQDPYPSRHKDLSQTLQQPLATVSGTMKDRYVIRSQHNQLGNTKFMPTSQSEAKKSVSNKIRHDLGDSFAAFIERKQNQKNGINESLKDGSVHHLSKFLAQSPSSSRQDINTLEQNNSYSVFLTSNQQRATGRYQLNQRQDVLDNFKTISKVLRQDFLSSKDDRYKQDQRFQTVAIKMAEMMKQLHHPTRYPSPPQLLSGMSIAQSSTTSLI